MDFPESQGGAQVYGTPWALSEDYYLCVYDATMRPGAGSQGQPYRPGNYGIYLVDSFGNKELIYRDPEIACLSPIPVRAEPVPPCCARPGATGAGDRIPRHVPRRRAPRRTRMRPSR